MAKKQTSAKLTNRVLIVSLITLVAAVVCGWIGYSYGMHKNNTNAIPSQNKAGYVVAQQASEQVTNFYNQYIRPSTTPDFRNKLVSSYGSKNLAFYDTYYKHGFDPVVCSTVMPISITTTQVTPGPSAEVKVNATYPDKSLLTIVTTVVINNDGLKIDSVNCPGNMGNLPPQ